MMRAYNTPCGICRFNPPQVIAQHRGRSSDTDATTEWPQTLPDAWCGKFEQSESAEVI